MDLISNFSRIFSPHVLQTLGAPKLGRASQLGEHLNFAPIVIKTFKGGLEGQISF